MDPESNGQRLIPTACDYTPTRNESPYQMSRYQILVSSLVHILPVGVTFGVLQLSFRRVYWADAEVAEQNVKLAALQVAAKVHEILILLSMSAMILHYARKLMVSSQGMSLGLLVAAYQAGLSGLPWTIGYWATLKQLIALVFGKERIAAAGTSRSVLPPLALFLLLAVFAFLALFVGPASAITMIPQLQWWERERFIGSWQNDAPPFSIYIPTTLFPTEVNSSHLPGSYCDNVTENNSPCPSAGATEVQESFTTLDYFWGYRKGRDERLQNITVSSKNNDLLTRRMIYLESNMQAAVTVPNFVLASFASLSKLSTPSEDNSYGDHRSYILEMVANGRPPLSPLVNVNCNDSPSDDIIRYYLYETDGFYPGNQKGILKEDVRKNATFDVRSVWEEKELAKDFTGFELIWKDMTEESDTPILLGLLRHAKGITICAVQSYWTSTSQWVLSAASYDTVTNFTFEGPKHANWSASMFQYPYALNERRIHIRENWAEALNPSNGSTKVLESVLEAITPLVPDWYSPINASINYSIRESMTAQILAKSVADGLSRIGAQYAANRANQFWDPSEIVFCNHATNWCSQGPWTTNNTMPHAIVANITRDQAFRENRSKYILVPLNWDQDNSPVMRSFVKPVNAEAIWTQVSFPVLRYGRGYAFQGVAMYLAVALLCFHALIVVVHVANRVLFDFQIFDFGGSLSSLLVLAMGENAPLESSMWTGKVALIPFKNEMERKKLKLVIAESTTDQMVFKEG